jgi:hypothetical protein
MLCSALRGFATHYTILHMKQHHDLKAQVCVRIEPELRAQLDRLAQRQDRDVSWVVRNVLRTTVIMEDQNGRHS